MKLYAIILTLVLVSCAQAGLPPTTSRKSGDASNVTTFNFQFPNFTGTRSGATTVFDNVSIAGGGTGATTKSAGFDALSPMTTSGDLIYGGTSGTGTRLPVGSNGNYLTVSGGVPAWSASAPGATTFSFAWGGANSTTACGSTPCPYLDQMGGSYVSSVTRTAAGYYVVNFSVTFTKIRCAPTLVLWESQNRITSGVNCQSCSSANFYMSNTALAQADGYGSMICHFQL